MRFEAVPTRLKLILERVEKPVVGRAQELSPYLQFLDP